MVDAGGYRSGELLGAAARSAAAVRCLPVTKPEVPVAVERCHELLRWFLPIVDRLPRSRREWDDQGSGSHAMHGFCLLLCLFLLAPPLLAADRVALVIGNARYANMGELTGPANDARDLAAALGGIGFRVLPVALDLREDQMLERIEAFAAQARGAEVALLYYSGHGIQVGGSNYLLPVDVDASSEARVRADGVSVDVVLDTLRRSGAGSMVVMLDACRDNPIAAAFRSASKGLARMDSPQGFMIAYATAAGAVARDLGSNGRNSPYAQAVLEELKQGAGVELEVFMRRVGTRVFDATQQQQFPATYNALTAAVVLAGRGVVQQSSPAVPAGEGELRIEVSPPEATVRLDGVLLGTGSRSVRQASGKTVLLRAEAAGHEALEERVLVQGGQVADVVLRLKPVGAASLPAPARMEQSAAGMSVNAAPAMGQPYRRRLRSGGEGPEMVIVPGGSFLMASPENELGRGDDDGPRRHVTIGSFAVGVTELTFADWDRCVAVGGCAHRPNDRGLGRGDRPVIDVSWDDAQAYLQWLSGETGRRYRLPTEAEWEYVARAGTTTVYWWGDTVDRRRANYCAEEYCGGTFEGEEDRWINIAPVKSFPANPWGLYDTSGNVWEMVQDCFGNDRQALLDEGVMEVLSCEMNVLRGGSWQVGPALSRASTKPKGHPANRSSSVGFRVAEDL